MQKAIQMVKHGLKYILIFLVTVTILTGMLVLAAKLPKSAIEDNVRESAEYLCQGELFGNVIEGVKNSKIDRYADSILLAIAYQYDSGRPLESIMWSSYYYVKYQNENENLLEAVTNGYEPNQQYLRYWHGSNVFVRPLLMVFNLQQIYVLNGIILIILVIWLMAVLIRNKAYAPAVGVLVGLVATASWFVPLSLEYTWTYIIMLVMSIIGVKLALHGKWNHMGIFFMVGGIITNYMDFLSTETLTLLVPLMLVLWVHMRKNESSATCNRVKFVVKVMVAWGCGYLGMWLMKWVLATIVLHENVMPYVMSHIGERLGGDIGLGLWKYITGALLNNIKCLFPFDYGTGGLFAGAVLVLMAVYIGYVYHKKHINKEHILLYLIMGLVPYIRYIVLHNHSYLHFFFTYRAQMATILAIVLILEELTERRWLHGNVRKRKP